MKEKNIILGASPISGVILKAVIEKTSEKSYVAIDRAVDMIGRLAGIDVDAIKDSIQESK